VDPLVEMGQESTSPYGYVLGNPIRLTDPDGRAPHDGPGPKWLRTALFSISHPIAAFAIGSANKSLNISSAAVRFSTRGESASSTGSILSEPGGWGNKGSEVNAFRHTIWQGTIASQFGDEIASGIGFAHEDNPNTNWGKDYTQMSFKSLTEADERIDLMNNMIGRDIGNENKGLGMKEIALKTLDVFKKDGLFTANKQEDGTFRISRTTISDKKYSALKKAINNLDANGFRSEEIRRKRREEQDRSRFFQ
jgi:hypothetical protein